MSALQAAPDGAQRVPALQGATARTRSQARAASSARHHLPAVGRSSAPTTASSTCSPSSQRCVPGGPARVRRTRGSSRSTSRTSRAAIVASLDDRETARQALRPVRARRSTRCASWSSTSGSRGGPSARRSSGSGRGCRTCRRGSWSTCRGSCMSRDNLRLDEGRQRVRRAASVRLARDAARGGRAGVPQGYYPRSRYSVFRYYAGRKTREV